MKHTIWLVGPRGDSLGPPSWVLFDGVHRTLIVGLKLCVVLCSRLRVVSLHFSQPVNHSRVYRAHLRQSLLGWLSPAAASPLSARRRFSFVNPIL